MARKTELSNPQAERDPQAGLRFAVLQPGARMHYAVPAILARAAMLHRLYTDICADIGLLPQTLRLWPKAWRPTMVDRLLGRQVPQVVDRRAIRQCGAGAVFAQWVHARITGSEEGAIDDCVMALARRDKFGGANALYTVLINSDLDLVREARQLGIKVVHEVMLSPDVGLWVREERDRYAGIEDPYGLEEVERGRARDHEKYQLADLILVPSIFARDAVLALGAPPERVTVVPYGVDASWLDEVPRPQPGRVLFVGAVGLRKGVPYLAEAMRILRRRGVKCEVRVVGPVEPELAANPAFEGPTYVGSVPRSEMRREFLQADLFVLPSVAEGSATVTYEALACGLPVVTTHNAGSVVRDGADGFIVPIRDAKTLADRIEEIVSNRELRGRLSAQARERAREYTWERYGERLIAAVLRVGG